MQIKNICKHVTIVNELCQLLFVSEEVTKHLSNDDAIVIHSFLDILSIYFVSIGRLEELSGCF